MKKFLTVLSVLCGFTFSAALAHAEDMAESTKTTKTTTKKETQSKKVKKEDHKDGEHKDGEHKEEHAK